MITKEEWERLGFENVDIQSEKTMGDRLDDLPDEKSPINQLQELKILLLGPRHISDCLALDRAIKALEFAEWVAEEIFSDDWEYNKGSFEEIVCRKLEKMEIVRKTETDWELVDKE